MAKVLVMIPSRDRPGEFAEAARSVLRTSKADVFGYVDDDQSVMYGVSATTNLRRDMPIGEYLGGRVSWIYGPRVGPVASANELVRRSPDYAAYGLITDDSRMTVPGWDEWLLSALDSFPNRIGVVSPYHNQGNHVDMPFVSRGWIEATGWFACPTCRHYAWPIVTGLIGEMTAIAHAPMDRFAVHHPHKTEMVSLATLHHDAQAFFEFVSLDLPKVVERVRQAMQAQVGSF